MVNCARRSTQAVPPRKATIITTRAMISIFLQTFIVKGNWCGSQGKAQLLTAALAITAYVNRGHFVVSVESSNTA